MKTIKLQNRKAFSLGLQQIGLITGAIIATAIIAVFGGEILSSGTTISSLDVTRSQLFTDNGIATLQVKNTGTTNIERVHGVLLITNVVGATTADCMPGTAGALVFSSLSGSFPIDPLEPNGSQLPGLEPGQSITISGELYNLGTISPSATVGEFRATANTTGSAICDTELINDEYLLQVSGMTENNDVVSKTVAVRGR